MKRLFSSGQLLFFVLAVVAGVSLVFCQPQFHDDDDATANKLLTNINTNSSGVRKRILKDSDPYISPIELTLDDISCVITPDPKTDIQSTFFSIDCPTNVTTLTVSFPEVRDDSRSLYDSNGSTTSSIKFTSSRQVNGLQLCFDVADPATCQQFSLLVSMTAGHLPVIDDVAVIGPNVQQGSFDPESDVYDVTTYANVPATFVLKGNYKEQTFVGLKNLTSSQGFYESISTFKHTARAQPGTTERVPVYALTQDRATMKSYDLVIHTIPSPDARLGELSISPGRLEPEFHSNTYSYFARVPPTKSSFTVSLTALDDKYTNCTSPASSSTTILGSGQLTVYAHDGHTIAIDCVSADGSHNARYALILVDQYGGNTELLDLDIVGGELDRPFDSYVHGPYIANLFLQRRNDVGWVSFVATSNNPNAIIHVEDFEVDDQGRSPWFRVEIGQFRHFKVSVRTAANPVEETYYVNVNRESRWYERLSSARKLSKWLGTLSTVAASNKASYFMQNVHFMQFLSATGRVNQLPETYGAFSAAFDPWNMQVSNKALVRSKEEIIHDASGNSSDFVFAMPPEPHLHILNARQTNDVTVEDGEDKDSVEDLLRAASHIGSGFLARSDSGKWAPALDMSDPSVAASVITALRRLKEAKTESGSSDADGETTGDGLVGATPYFDDNDKLEIVQTVNSEFMKRRAIMDYMSSIVLITILLGLTTIGYFGLVALSIRRCIRKDKTTIRDLHVALHPFRFWTFVGDIALMAYAQACLGILACPSELRSTKFIVMGFIETTPKATIWFAVLVLLLFPIAYLFCVAWALFAYKESVVYSQEMCQYTRGNVTIAKAESKILPWLPIISNLLAIEIRDITPIFAAEDRMVDESREKRLPVAFHEDKCSGGPCSVIAPEAGALKNREDPISQPNDPNSTNYNLLNTEESSNSAYRSHYHPDDEEIKVSLGGFNARTRYDYDNFEVYDKYPEAVLGRKTMQVVNPYGQSLLCNVRLQLKHLYTLMINHNHLPHHFHFWIPKKNLQMNDLDGWGSLFELAQRGNYFYYIFDRVAYLSIIAFIVMWQESSGFITSLLVAGVCLLMCAIYTPSAIASGTSKWHSAMEQEARNKKHEETFNNIENEREEKWPFTEEEMMKKAQDMQAKREAADCCGHGGSCTRHPDCGFSELDMWKYRSWMCTKEFFTGAPGVELTKCLTVAFCTLGNMSRGVTSNGVASLSSFVVCCVGSFLMNYESLQGVLKQFGVLWVEICRGFTKTSTWMYGLFSDMANFGGRFGHLFSTLWKHVIGQKNASYDFPGYLGECSRDFKVTECHYINDEVGMQFKGPLRPDEFNVRRNKKVANRNVERHELYKTLYQSGPLSVRRPDLDKTMPIRIPYSDFFLGKKQQVSGLAATIQIVNHGSRCEVSDPKIKNALTEEDDSYFSIYRDPRFLPNWGEVRTSPNGHGYAAHYDRGSHTITIKGPGIQPNVDYHIRTDQRYTPQHQLDTDAPPSSSTAAYTSEITNGRCKKTAVCTSSGSVEVVKCAPPCLYSPITVTGPMGQFQIIPDETKVYYDDFFNVMTLRHHQFQDHPSANLYSIEWTVAGTSTPINQSVTCQELGILEVRLNAEGIPDMKNAITLSQNNGDMIVVDPSETDSHRVLLPKRKEARGVALLWSRFTGYMTRWMNQVRGSQVLCDTIEDGVPCTVVNCVNPILGVYRVEPNFKESKRIINAQINCWEAQREDLDDISRLAKCWIGFMPVAEFNKFWKDNGVNISPAPGMWINPLEDSNHALLSSQQKRIQDVVPKFRDIISGLFAVRINELRAEARLVEQWRIAYEDRTLYAAQLDKDRAEFEGNPNLDSYIGKLKAYKQQYESQIPNFRYPMTVEESCLSVRPNLSAQLRQWGLQVVTWLGREENASMCRSSLESPRSIASSASSGDGYDSSCLERTLEEVMYAIKDNINRREDPVRGEYRTVLHFVTDSVRLRGPPSDANWRPDPIGGHLALVRLWKEDENGQPDFSSEPFWMSCCLKLSGGNLKLLFPGPEDVYSVSPDGVPTIREPVHPHYWGHVFGFSVPLDVLEALELSNSPDVSGEAERNPELGASPAKLVCHLTSKAEHIDDGVIKSVDRNVPENGVPLENGVHFVSFGKRIPVGQTGQYQPNEVRVANGQAQAMPLTFRFSERFIEKWRAVIEGTQMDLPPRIEPVFDESEYLPDSGVSSGESTPKPVVPLPEPPAEPVSESEDEEEKKTFSTRPCETKNFTGTGPLRDSNGEEIYNGAWVNGKRWGHGVSRYMDKNGRMWTYTGQHVDDAPHGKGELLLCDRNALQELQTSETPEHRRTPVRMEGVFHTPNQRRLSYPALDEKSLVSPHQLQKLVAGSSSSNDNRVVDLLIDVPRAISAGDDYILGLAVPNALAHINENDEAAPSRLQCVHRSDPTAKFPPLEACIAAGAVHYADGSVYKGSLHNGIPNGYGSFMTADEGVRCTGTFRNGLPHGEEVALLLRKPDGTVSAYCGAFKDGKRHGHGVQTSKDGKVYVEGEWVDDVLGDSPNAVIEALPEVLKSKKAFNSYSGPIRNGLPDGEGTVIWPDGATHQGQFKQGKRHGKGSTSDSKGKKLVAANWKNDLPHGKVDRLVVNDFVYSGAMSEGKRQGIGALKLDDETSRGNKHDNMVYEGLWMDDVPHGRGTLYLEEGIYDGEFNKGQRCGKGALDFDPSPTGKKQQKYEGDWKNDVPEGIGKFTPEEGDPRTYKYTGGHVDKSSIKAYQGGMCTKSPATGAHPVFKPEEQKRSQPTMYGENRPVNELVFRDICGDDASNPLWDRVVSSQPGKFLDPSRAPSEPRPVKYILPERPTRTTSAAPVPRPGPVPPVERPGPVPPVERPGPVPPVERPGPVAPVERPGPVAPVERPGPVAPVPRPPVPLERPQALEVVVIGGDELPPIDGALNPYVKVIFGKEMKRTANQTRTTNPRWNEPLNFHLTRQGVMDVEVWHANPVEDKVVAKGTVDLAPYMSVMETGPIQVPLVVPSTGAPAGVVVLKMRLSAVGVNDKDDDFMATRPTKPVGGGQADFDPVIGDVDMTKMVSPVPYIALFIKEGRGLPNMDVGKNMDPYVRVTMGTTKFATDPKSRAGSDPKFNEHVSLPYNKESRIIFEVYDKDHMSKDDFVGRGELDVPSNFSGELKLYRPDKKAGTIEAGVLLLTMKAVLN